MLEFLFWSLICLFCINRVILWAIFSKRKNFGPYGTAVIIINHLTTFALPFVPQPRIWGIWYIYVIGGIIFIGGCAIIKKAEDEFHKMKNRPDTVTTKLMTYGIYAKVRHPIYLGSDIYFIGWVIAWGAIWSMFTIPLVIFANWLQAFLEEKYILEKEFKSEYQEYKTKVGMFIPKI